MAKKDFMSLMKEKTVDVKPSLLSAEENIKSQIVILDELRDLIPPLTVEELSQLEQNILKHGVKDPLTIWETTASVVGLGTDETPAYVLIDGHNRYKFIQKHHLDFRINLVRIATLAEVRDYMIDYQLGRRNLTPEQTSYLRGLRYNQQKTMRGSSQWGTTQQTNVAETLAAEYGVSSRTIKRDGAFAAELDKLDPEQKRDALAGKTSRAAIKALTQSNSSVPEEPVVNGTLEQPSVKTAKRIASLQERIQKLAGTPLTVKSCEEVIEKANELLTLLSSK